MLCAIRRRTPAARAASTRWRVPSMRTRALAAESRALRSVSWCITTSGWAADTAVASPARSKASTTAGTAPMAGRDQQGDEPLPHDSCRTRDEDLHLDPPATQLRCRPASCRGQGLRAVDSVPANQDPQRAEVDAEGRGLATCGWVQTQATCRQGDDAADGMGGGK